MLSASLCLHVFVKFITARVTGTIANCMIYPFHYTDFRVTYAFNLTIFCYITVGLAVSVCSLRYAWLHVRVAYANHAPKCNINNILMFSSGTVIFTKRHVWSHQKDLSQNENDINSGNY